MSVIEKAEAAIAAVEAAFLDADALASLAEQDVVELLARTATLGRAVDAQRVRLAGAVADRSARYLDTPLCKLLGSRSPKDAIAKAFSLRGRDAAELLSVAAATSSSVGFTGETIEIPFPRVAAAIDEGELTVAQARAIVEPLGKVAPYSDLDQLAWAEGCLVDEATHPEHPLVPELLTTQTQAYVATLDPDGVLPGSERQIVRRSFYLKELPDGGYIPKGYLTPEGGAIIKSALDAETTPRAGVRFVDDPDDQRGEEIEIPADNRTRTQKYHDALVGLAQGHVASGRGRTAGLEVPCLVLTGSIDAFDAYTRGIEHPDRGLRAEHTGAILPIETVDRLLCDGVVQRAVTDSKSHVLDLGRTTRTFTKSQRRALAAQYRGCATPGCGFPAAWTEAHHVIPWSEGGTTDTAYGILLCSHCHHEVHAGRLLIVGEPGNWRVVANLRTADRYARNRRRRTEGSRATMANHARPPLPPTPHGRTTIAHAAPPSLAVKLREPAPPIAATTPGHLRQAPTRSTRPPRLRTGPVEHRLRQRLPGQFRRRVRVDHPPSRTDAPSAPATSRKLQHIVLQT